MRAMKGTVVIKLQEEKKETASGLILAGVSADFKIGPVTSSGIDGVNVGDIGIFRTCVPLKDGYVRVDEANLLALED